MVIHPSVSRHAKTHTRSKLTRFLAELILSFYIKTSEVAAGPGLDNEVKLSTGYFLNFIDFISALEKAKGKQINN